MNKPKVSIIIPTRDRSELFITRLQVLEKNTRELSTGEAELLLVIDEDDEESQRIPSLFKCTWVISPPLETPAKKWNRACPPANGEWLVTMSDDSLPHPNWLTNALETRNYGFLGLPDNNKDRNWYFTPLYMATREWLKKYNGGVLVIPHYGIWYADIETAERARKSLTYVVAWNSIVEQLHYDYGSAPDDKTYAIGRSRRLDDVVMFENRKKRDFPDDFEGVL